MKKIVLLLNFVFVFGAFPDWFYKIPNIYQQKKAFVEILLPLIKNENRKILRQNNIEINLPYGCPLVKKAHKHKHMRKFTIQRILREVRAQVVDKEEGLRNIIKMI